MAGLVAVLTLASMMLVMFSGCISYRDGLDYRAQDVGHKGNTIVITLEQAYDTEKKTYSANGSEGYSVYALPPGMTSIAPVRCSKDDLKEGVHVEVSGEIELVIKFGKGVDKNGNLIKGINSDKKNGITGTVYVQFKNIGSSGSGKWSKVHEMQWI